jgi:hypothetical protein
MLSISVYAQPFSLGLIGGASLTEDFQNFNRDVGYGYTSLAYSTPYRWMAGGTAEARLPFHLSLEVDGMFHELEFSTQVLGNGLKPYLVPNHVVTWEFPVLVKYRFPLPAQFSTWSRVKPFIDAGPAFRSAGNLSWTSPSNHGVAAGLGMEVRLWQPVPLSALGARSEYRRGDTALCAIHRRGPSGIFDGDHFPVVRG